ncbi:MAG: hypothetical protein HW398_928, partial [Acidobacteria bacterium]|nr:hypothetical protein [Acidobacteriota bacterium]
MKRVVAVVVISVAASTSALARSEACRAATDKEIASLFDRWNSSLR